MHTGYVQPNANEAGDGETKQSAQLISELPKLTPQMAILLWVQLICFISCFGDSSK